MVIRSIFQEKRIWACGTDRLREAIEFSPVVVVAGARQAGKSTLLRNESPVKDWPYVSLDDMDRLALSPQPSFILPPTPQP